MSLYSRSHELLAVQNSQLLVIDMQEKFVPHIAEMELVTDNCHKLLEAAQKLDVPKYATEQYPKGLGKTIEKLAGYFDEIPEKLRFSSAEVLNWKNAAEREDNRFQLVIAGIETHICLLQTTFDFLAQGYRVYIPADAVGSRHKLDKEIALQRMADAGAIITTTESVLFEWCEIAGTDLFKEISKLVK
ncbi:Isochorismatase [hydrothermal vent metagenome]|uniref:Isochorismatase n=1 Tax=hydrothermal vent metagenome TaxID=652676 RepID=A0A3B1E8J9_9ZZZZ